MENAQPSGGDSGGSLGRVHAAARGLAADQPHALILNEVVERADGVRAAAHASQHRVRQAAFPLQHLRPDLPGDHRLEIAHEPRT